MDGIKENGLKNESLHSSISKMDDNDFSRFLNKLSLSIERQNSFDERSLSESLVGLAGEEGLESFKSICSSPGGKSILDSSALLTWNSLEPHPAVAKAWEGLRQSLVYFRGQPVGTVAAHDHASEEILNYDQVFVRDFVPSGLAFLMNGEPAIVKNFLLKALHLQGWEKRIDRFELGKGRMPASFKIVHDPIRKIDTLRADFGESAIGRVAPVDSGIWWIILLHAYTKSTGVFNAGRNTRVPKGDDAYSESMSVRGL